MGESKRKIVGILGFGNMGQAIFSILKKDKNYKLLIHSLGVRKVNGALCLDNIDEFFAKSDIAFLCIKPQDFYQLKRIGIKNKKLIVISIMAGVKKANIMKFINTKKIVRTMPNLALNIGEAVIGWSVNKENFAKNELEIIKKILDRFGHSFFFEKEKMLDEITAISGSGPAYVFLFADALVKSAQSLGFNKKEAYEIVNQTIMGSIKYAQKNNDCGMEELIVRIKSKKGTTEAALNQIDIINFYKVWQKAIKSASDRAKELSNGIK
ncbi:MAG TPA: pyrroline-5-carboxylate reductase dimerization domain-containing protein [Patescibacteria group bacterium]|nr:pyrroline-5-carboxylate reductase dimerization domain-containing protein [Patescibacteria group bacterium]